MHICSNKQREAWGHVLHRNQKHCLLPTMAFAATKVWCDTEVLHFNKITLLDCINKTLNGPTQIETSKGTIMQD